MDYPPSSPHPDSKVLFFFMKMIFFIYLGSPTSCFLHLEASSVYHTGFAHQISQDLKKNNSETSIVSSSTISENTILNYKDIKLQKLRNHLALCRGFHSASFLAEVTLIFF